MPSRPQVSAAVVFVLLFANRFQAQSTGSRLALSAAERIGGQSVAAVATDADGNVWAVGSASFNPIATTSDALQPTMRASGDAFAVKVRPDGTIAYATYLGGSGADEAHGVAIDPSGAVYIVGQTNSTDFPVTPDAFQRTAHGVEGYVAKMSPDGRSITYATYLGGAGTDNAVAVSIDGIGRVHVTGTTDSADFPRTGGAIGSPVVMRDVFYTRFSAYGTVELSTPIGGSRGDDAGGIATDAAGNAYVTGWTSSPDFPVQRAIKPSYPATAGSQGFLAKFTPAGLDFSTYIGGSNSDQAYAVAVSPAGVYLGGLACSGDFPGAPRPSAPANACAGAGFIARIRTDGSAFAGTVLFDGSGFDDRVLAVAVNANDDVFASGFTNSTDFPVTQDAEQIAPSAHNEAFFAKVAIPDASPSRVVYATYLGGTQDDYGFAVAADGSGGAWAGGWTNSSADFPRVNAAVNSGAGFVVRYSPIATPPPASDDVVLYARGASAIAGSWRLIADDTAAGGMRMESPDAGVPKIGAASANPANYVELTFEAQAGVPYHLWLRMKAAGDSWTNDSVFVQFSDAVDAFGNPAWRVGTTAATVVSLEDCTGCGEQGWGWNDNGYDTPGALVYFPTSGTHTIRIQQREDGISIDQIALSTRTYINSAPGTNKNDTTILAMTPPPPPPVRNEIVLWARDRSSAVGAWQSVADASAAGGSRLLNPDAGQPKLTVAAAAPANYFEIVFDADAGVPYHLWLRMKAEADSWQNDSAFVQFSDSVDGSANPLWRIGTTSATVVSLEDCSGCGEQGWGWNDNGYDTPGTLVTFATGGSHTIRVQQREDGVSIDQVVLSAVTYRDRSPGAPKNDTTILPK